MLSDRYGDQTSLAELSGYLANYYFDPARLAVLERILDGVTPYGHTGLQAFDGSPHRMLSADGMRLLDELIASGDILRVLETTESLSWNSPSAVHGSTDQFAETFGERRQSDLWLFPHIPKAGGNTFRVLAHEVFGTDLLDVPWPGNALVVVPWRVLTARCLTGHGAGALEQLGLYGRQARHVVTVRNPLERTVSWWLQDVLPRRTVEDHSAKGLAHALADWANKAFSLGAVEIGDLTNAQSRWLVYPPSASSGGWPWFGEVGPPWDTPEELETDLAPKLDSYLSRCAYMGLPEDASLIVAAVAREEGIGYEPRRTARENASVYSAAAISAKLPASIVKAFKGITALDYVAFEAALERRGELNAK